MPPEAAAAAAAKTLTEYTILRDQTLNGATDAPAGTLAIVKTVKAKSAADAIRQAAGNTEGTYRAVPARSFAPVKVTVETKTTLKLG